MMQSYKSCCIFIFPSKQKKWLHSNTVRQSRTPAALPACDSCRKQAHQLSGQQRGELNGWIHLSCLLLFWSSLISPQLYKCSHSACCKGNQVTDRICINYMEGEKNTWFWNLNCFSDIIYSTAVQTAASAQLRVKMGRGKGKNPQGWMQEEITSALKEVWSITQLQETMTTDRFKTNHTHFLPACILRVQSKLSQFGTAPSQCCSGEMANGLEYLSLLCSCMSTRLNNLFPCHEEGSSNLLGEKYNK